MSGGVGPASDISLPKDEPSPPQNLPPKITPKQTTPLGFFTFRQLNSLAFMLVLSASGMVSLQDFTTVIFSTIYIYFLSKFSFPKQSTTQEPVFNQKSKILNIYILFAAVLGLFLPILYIFEGILEGDKEGIKAAVPHVFLLASQVFMEGVSASCRFSLPIRVFVPVFYNSVRMFTLIEWLKDEFLRFGGGGGGGLSRRLVVGRGLAVANFGLWSFNLFGFLLPVYLPKALQRYYGNGTNASSSKSD